MKNGRPTQEGVWFQEPGDPVVALETVKVVERLSSSPEGARSQAGQYGSEQRPQPSLACSCSS